MRDGVFAIAMTLLALELRLPEHWSGRLDDLVAALGQPFDAYVWSFVAISIFWVNHRRLFASFSAADSVLTFLALLFLAQITLIPPATRLLDSAQTPALALSLYLGLFALAGCTNAAAWIHAWSRNLVAPRPAWRR